MYPSKILKILGFLILLPAVGPVCGAASDSAAGEASPPPLIVSQDHAWPPMAFRDSSGEPRGLLVDLWRALGQELGRPVRFELVDWPRSLTQVREGQAQVHGGLFPSPQRSAFFDFSRPLMPMQTVVFVAGDSDTRSLLAPGLAPLGVVAGSYELEYLRRHFPDISRREYPNNRAMVTAAVQGELRAFVADYPVGLYLLDELAPPGRFHVEEVLYRQELVAAVPKGEQALLDEINAAIDALPREELLRITNRWVRTRTVEVTPPWLWPGLIILALVALLIFAGFYSYALRRQRNRLTRELDERNQEMQALFDYSPVSVLVHDQHSAQVLRANPQALRSHGVADVEELNRRMLRNPSAWGDPPYSWDDALQWIERARDEGPQHFEWLTYDTRGNTIWEEVFLQPTSVAGESRIVSTAIDITAKKEAEDRLQRQIQLEKLIRHASFTLLMQGSSETDNAINQTLAELGEFMTASRSVIYLFNREENQFALCKQWCAPGVPERREGLQLPVEVLYPYYQRLRDGKAVVVSIDDEYLPAFGKQAMQAGNNGSVLVLPITYDGDLQGALIFSDLSPTRCWLELDIKFAQIAADLLGGALARHRLEHELQHQASHDNLTDLYNRRKFEALLAYELERAMRYQHPLAVIMFDIDHFKRVNDRHGHDIGDQVLRKIADILQVQLRKTDLLARWGGEEFMLLLPETALEGALQTAEQLREQVAITDFPGVGQITISLGVT
ncbi:MAG: diguanylate cyclase, partial [Pseudomonadota bacterium]|nr:diguanylate cyclase [Pseudomonadota bacterium]